MRNQIALLVVGVAFFIVSCQTGHGPAATPSPNPQTTTLAPTQTDVASGSTTTPKCFTTMEGNPIAFMPDSIRILIRENERVRIFNLETMKEEKYFQAPQGFGPVALSPDGDLLAWALQDYSIQLIRMTDGNLLNTLQGHTLPVTKLRFSTAGDRLFSASVDTWIRIWDRNGKLLGAFQPSGSDNLPNEIEGIGISPDNTMLGSVPFDGPARVWNLADKKEIVNLKVSGGDVTSDIAFSPDGQFVAADPLGQLSLWRTSDWKKIWSGVTSMAFAFSPDSRFLAYSDMDNNSTIFVRSLDGAQQTRTLESQQTFIYDLLFSPDGALLASAGAGIHIWQFESGELLNVGKATCP